MRDREQDFYEIIGGFMLMILPFFYFCGWQWKLILLLGASAVLYWVLFCRKNILFYLMVSALFLAAAYLIGNGIFQKIYLCVGMALGVGGYYYGKQFGKQSMFTGISFSHLMWPLIGHLLAVHQNNDPRKDRTCVFVILYIILCLISQNRKNVKIFMKENGDLHRFPKKQLRKRSHVLMAAVCVLMIGAMVTSYRIAPDVTFELVLVRGGSYVKVEQMEGIEEEEEDIEYVEPFFETPMWLGAVGEVLFHITLVFIIVVLGGLMVLSVVRMCQVYKKKMEAPPMEEPEEEEDLAEDLMPEMFSLKDLFERKTPAEMIRKYYKKWIKSALKNVPKTDTPLELEQKAKRIDEEVHRLYEKARYSYMECTPEESKIVKQKI